MASVFFQTTEAALTNITNTFDFVHPLQVSLKFTRRKAAELNVGHENDADEYFQAQIDPIQEVRGVRYRASFIETSWENQEEQLAWILLNNLFAIHEGWADSLYHKRFEKRGYICETFVKDLEKKKLLSKFASYFITSNRKSTLLTNAYFDVYKTTSGLDFSKLDNYMLMYRYFKEMRNCFMHGNGIASSRVVGAYNEYIPIATLADLDVKEVPQIIPPVLGQPLKITLRGVIGFSQFVQRILIISDIYLLQTLAAEDELLDRKPPQSNKAMMTLSTNSTRAKEQIAKLSKQAGFLEPQWSEDFQRYLISNGFIKR